ncbi:MAG: DUF3267 domain-containing protein [Cyclobacteriaceae bacterium]
MKIRPEALENNGYILQDSLHFDEIIPFVKEYMNKKTFASIFYFSFNILLIGLLGLDIGKKMATGSFDKIENMYFLFSGILLALLLLPVHELIHLIAFKVLGAKKVSLDMNLKKFYFLAMADGFVVNKWEFRFIAILPFLLISIGLGFGWYWVDQPWSYTFFGALIVHSAMCSGDFGLLSYFDFQKNLDVLTYDDKKNRVSHFYIKSDLK